MPNGTPGGGDPQLSLSIGTALACRTHVSKPSIHANDLVGFLPLVSQPFSRRLVPWRVVVVGHSGVECAFCETPLAGS